MRNADLARTAAVFVERVGHHLGNGLAVSAAAVCECGLAGDVPEFFIVWRLRVQHLRCFDDIVTRDTTWLGEAPEVFCPLRLS